MNLTTRSSAGTTLLLQASAATGGDGRQLVATGRQPACCRMVRPLAQWGQLRSGRGKRSAASPVVATAEGSKQRFPPGMKSSFSAADTPPEEPDSIKERYRVRLFQELREQAVRRGQDAEGFDRGVKALETVVGTFTPDISAMNETEWVNLIMDSESLANKIVVVKTAFPSLDIIKLILKKPRVFLATAADLGSTCQQVLHLLRDAPDPGAIISETPDLMETQMLASAIVTFQRWWPEKDPIQVLQDEGGYWLRFTQEHEIPLDPVYYDGKTWTVPAFDPDAPQQPWKEFIAKKAKAEEERAKARDGFIF